MEKVDSLENVNSQERLVVSIHIPKCGGTSIGKMLEAQVQPLFIYQGSKSGMFVVSANYDGIIQKIANRTGDVSFEEAFNLALLSGATHIHGNIPIDYLLPYLDKIRLMTFVREPKERLHSEFCHNALRFGMNFTEKDFYRYFNNGIYYYTRGMWNLFEFIGRFERFSEDVAKLGLVELHENKAEKEKAPIKEPDALDKYTTIDQEVYNELINNYTNTPT